ncbi:carboxypeptidase regulatory-like domain-containing protein [Streptomyces griseorubiginosus]|nr:carboxypeptidase regulatory-like domain-containing protein [Streptomyces griseorubiginosus]WUB50205.1 carboxypeptidase regulatory-like domain-containing protein [Streptomyces griseorubiginosus]WUB58729.1 carboxypeptidase regulatory-like domain-containing protein [Streptomyces griseorubiginosus]
MAAVAGAPVAAEPVSTAGGVAGAANPTDAGGTSGLVCRVQNSFGRPVAGAALTLIDRSGRLTARARTREDGSGTMPRPHPGAYTLVVAAEGHRPQATNLMVGDGPASCTVTLPGDAVAPGTAGTAGTASVHGVVCDAEGTPLAGATVLILDPAGDVVARSTSGAGGDYALSGLRPGQFTLQVSAPGRRPAAVPVEVEASGGARHDLTLHPAGALTGTVRQGRTGRPLADARVTLLNADGVPVASFVTTDDGTYTLTDLAPGAYTLVAAGYPPVASRLTLGHADAATLDLDLAQPAE